MIPAACSVFRPERMQYREVRDSRAAAVLWRVPLGAVLAKLGTSRTSPLTSAKTRPKSDSLRHSLREPCGSSGAASPIVCGFCSMSPDLPVREPLDVFN